MTLGNKIGGVRWSVLAVLFAVTVINYADRATLALAAPLMTKELGIDPLQLGIVFSAFGWSYVIAQVPGGWLLDRFGVKRVYPVNATTLGLEFYGVEAAAKKALGISIKLKRVELSGDKITILDVPIIGKVDVKLSDIANPDQKTTLVCGA